jgi:hypothetical protein
MSSALVGLGVWLVIVLMITAVITRVQRNWIRRHRVETPEYRFRREIPDLRPIGQTSLSDNGDAAEAPRPVVGADELAALVQRAVEDAPEREILGDYRRQRRAKGRRKVWAVGTADAGFNYYGAGHIHWGGGGGDCDRDDRGGGGDCPSGGGGCGGGGD